MDTITRLDIHDFHDHIKALAEILTDAVDSGASVGFLRPLYPDEAADWWRARAAAVASGDLGVWVSRGPGGVTGTVSLAFADKPNARYRAELIKLMVHRDARRKGIGRRLLATAEEAAAVQGIALLLLDTETASDAEHLYHATGWTRYGVVPGYAADPGGAPRDCSFFYKQLTADDAHLQP
jgi:GNAT superfamily N-acetyltransferase